MAIFSNTLYSTALAALLFGTSGRAQVVEETPKHREQIERGIREKTQRMREGSLVQANVRVTVRLLNGSRLRGVVKDGRFIERIDGKQFIETDQRGPSAGLRLWYYDDTDSYIFLPYDSIRRYKIGEKLTDAEVKEISQRIDAARLAARAQRQARLAAQQKGAEQAAEAAEKAAQEAGGPGGATPAKPGGEQEPEPEQSRLTERQRALLTEFPPEDGWGMDRFRELETRKITLGVFPSKREQRFLDSFAEWNEANELKQAEGEQPAPPDAPPKEKPGKGGGDRGGPVV